jgi:glucose-1-phosphate adenylyltransferase
MSALPPEYFGPESDAERTIVGGGSDIYGKVYNSVIGCNCTIGEGTVIRDSIIMNGSVIGKNCRMEKVIMAEDAVVGDGCAFGEGEEVPNETDPSIYREGLVVIGDHAVIPNGISTGKNVLIAGNISAEDIPGGRLESGKTLVKEGD